MVDRLTGVSRQRAAWDASALAALGLAAWLLARAVVEAGVPLDFVSDWRRWLVAGALVPAGAAVYGWRRWRERIVQLASIPAAAVSPFHAVFTANPQPMWVIDADTLAFLEVNDAACRHYGYAREQFLNLTVADVRLPSDMPEARRRIVSRQPTEGFIGRHRRRDGSLFDVEIVSHALRWHGRDARVAMVRDVSDRVAAERALQRSEARYRQLFEHDLAGIFRLTADGRVLEANPAFARIFGFEAAAGMIDPAAGFVFASGDPLRDLLRRLRADGACNGVELRLHNRHAQPLWLLVNARLAPDSRGEIIEGTLVDITERKQLEAQYRQSQKMEAVGRLAAGVAHDFNNLLTVVNGYSDLMLAKEAAAPFHPKLRMIREAGERATKLTRQLLAFSRQQVLQPQPLDLNHVIREIQDTLQTLTGESRQLCLRLAPDALPIFADAGQMEQVLINLAMNARDAMIEGGALTIATARVDLDAAYTRLHPGVTPGPFVCLSVTDTGKGMDAATQAHLFEPFFSTKSKDQGSGLGLATVFGIVQQSGGHIDVESELGVGTTVRVSMPLLPAAADSTSVAESAPALGGETVLLVEDEEFVRGLAEELLSAQGYRVLAAALPSAALALSRNTQDRIHLLLTDVLMPEMNGRALAKILAGERPDLRVLYMSGYPAGAINSETGLDEALAFVQKPFTAETLWENVRQVLAAAPDTYRTH